MRTIIGPAGHVLDVVTHELTDLEQAAITANLADQGIPVALAIDVYHHLHLWALAELTSRQEAIALRAAAARTDARMVWHKAEASRG